MKSEKKTGLKGSLIVAAVCTLLVWGWNKLFGPIAGLLTSSIVRHGWKATFPDHRSLALLAIFLGFWAVKRMIRSLQRDALGPQQATSTRRLRASPSLRSLA